MKNILIQTISEAELAELAGQLLVFIHKGDIKLTVVHQGETIETVIDFLEDDGDVAHLLHTSPTDRISNSIFCNGILSFKFGTPQLSTPHTVTLNLLGAQIHFEENEVVLQAANDQNVYIFEQAHPINEYMCRIHSGST